MSDDQENIKKLGLAVLKIEAAAIKQLYSRIDDSFVKACQYILKCKGRVVVTGMGKSGHIGSKIAATLASTGTPAFFLHPGEASHGDLGMVVKGDVVLAISNSGDTAEIATILPIIKRLGVPLISMTGNPDSVLSREAEANLDISVSEEACPLGLAPTASTTATLAMGDALAVALLETKNFTAEDFARSHPGGRLGRRLLVRVGDIMHTGKQMPVSKLNDSLKDALVEMTAKGQGMTTIIDENNIVKGIFTDGDLRRTLDNKPNIHDCEIKEAMVKSFVTIGKDQLAAEAVKLMDDKQINNIPVVNDQQELIGTINMHDLLRSGVV